MCNERKMDTPDRQQHITDDAGGPILSPKSSSPQLTEFGVLGQANKSSPRIPSYVWRKSTLFFVSQIKVRFLWGIPRGVTYVGSGAAKSTQSLCVRLADMQESFPSKFLSSGECHFDTQFLALLFAGHMDLMPRDRSLISSRGQKHLAVLSFRYVPNDERRLLSSGSAFNSNKNGGHCSVSIHRYIERAMISLQI